MPLPFLFDAWSTSHSLGPTRRANGKGERTEIAVDGSGLVAKEIESKSAAFHGS